jgi:hypothetical protein
MRIVKDGHNIMLSHIYCSRHLKKSKESPLTLLLLRGVNHNPIQIRTLDTLAIVKTTNSNSVLALLERKKQRRREDNALVRILLVQSVNVLLIAINDDAADAANGPGSVDAIG